MHDKRTHAAADVSVDPDMIVDAIAPALGLRIDAAHRPGVIALLDVASAMARIVYAVPLHDDSLEMAAVFRPGLEQER